MSENDHLSGRQIAAGRTLLGLDQTTLAEMANISVPTLRRMERSSEGVSGYANNVLAVRAALESLGIIFEGLDDDGGLGVRMGRDAA